MNVFKVDNSSQIEAIAHENDILLVKFKTGTIYSYSGVPIDVFNSMCNAESKGKFLNESIKPKYAFTKLTDF